MTTTSSTTSESSPPAWAEPLFSLSADQALSLYNSGSGGNTYTGSTVSDLSDTTLQGLNQLAQAGSNWNTSQTYPLYQQIGAAAVSDPYLASISGVGDAAGSVYGTAGQPTAASNYLTDYASGKYLTEGNPYYRQLLDKATTDANSLIKSQYSGMGATGSGAEQKAIADNTSGMLLQGLNDDWNRMLDAQFNATGMIDSANSQSIQNQLAALGLQGGMYGTASSQYGAGVNNALAATNAMSSMDQQQFVNQLSGAQAVLDAGGAVDTQAQKQLDDAVSQWYGLDMQDWTQLGLLQAAAGGAAGPYGTGTSETSSFNPGALLTGMFSGK